MDIREEYLKFYKINFGQGRYCSKSWGLASYKAGQQSKQAEIDALKAKIEEIEKWAEFYIEDYNLSESDSEHDRGWFNAACQVFKSLKRD